MAEERRAARCSPEKCLDPKHPLDSPGHLKHRCLIRSIDDSRRRFLDAAAKTLALHPAATLEEIAHAADSSRATLHRLFPSRSDLIRDLADDALDEIAARQASAASAAGRTGSLLDQLVHQLVPLGERFHFLASENWLDREPVIAKRLEMIRQWIQEAIRAERTRGLLRTDVPEEWQAELFVELVYLGWKAIADQILVPRDAVKAAISAFREGQGQTAQRAARRSRGSK